MTDPNVRILKNTTTGEVILPRARLCQSYWCHFVGLQFRRNLPPDHGLLFVTQFESTIGTTIHMLNMFFSIGVIWLDHTQTVVDTTLAKPWRLAYAPAKPAKYYIEASPHILDRVTIGDQLQFDEVYTG